MIGLRYVGASRSQGLWQEAPPSPAAWPLYPGSWGTGLQNHQLEGSQFQAPTRADFSGKDRRHSALGPTCQHPVLPHSQDSEGSNSPSPAEVLL